MPKIVDHEEQRLLLSATVAEVVADSGLEHTTLRTVAARHGCTKGMVQHYFADKGELLLAAFHFIENARDARLPGPEAGRGLEIVHALFLAQLPLQPALLDEWRVRLAFFTLAGQSEAISAAIAERQLAHQNIGIRLLRQAQRARELRAGLSPLNCYRHLMALVNGLAVAAVASDTQWSGSVQKALLKGAINDLRR